MKVDVISTLTILRISSLEDSTRGGWWVSLDSRIGSPAPLNKSLGSVCIVSGGRGFQPSALHVIFSGGIISRGPGAMIQSVVLVYLLEEAHNRVSAIQSPGKILAR